MLQDFFFRLKPKQYKNANIADCLKIIWKLIKQNKLFDGIIDVIFDDPYLTELKDSANVADKYGLTIF